MTPHDPEDTALPVEKLVNPEHALSEPLHRLGDACEALQTWASDTASAVNKGGSQGHREARAARVLGEALLSEVLSSAAPVLGTLARQGVGQ